MPAERLVRIAVCADWSFNSGSVDATVTMLALAVSGVGRCVCPYFRPHPLSASQTTFRRLMCSYHRRSSADKENHLQRAVLPPSPRVSEAPPEPLLSPSLPSTVDW